MPEFNFNDSVAGTAVVVDELGHPDVAVREPTRVVEGRYTPDLTRF